MLKLGIKDAGIEMAVAVSLRFQLEEGRRYCYLVQTKKKLLEKLAVRYP